MPTIRSEAHQLPGRRDNTLDVGKQFLLQPLGERHRTIRVGDAAYRRVEPGEGLVGGVGADLGSEAGGLLGFVDDEGSVGFLYGLVDRFLVVGYEGPQVDDFGFDAFLGLPESDCQT